MFIGIDLGTSSVKVILMNETQTILASASSELNVSRPHSGWSEQDPADWIKATQSAMAELKNNYKREMQAVIGIGLSGHMHGATLIGASHEVLRPCMLWNDTRSYLEAAEMDNNPIFRSLTGNIVFPGFTAPKIEWVRRNEPHIFERIEKILLPKDYLRLWLTGETVSEMSDASGTSWLNVARRCWSDELLVASGLTKDHMPRLVEGSDVSGTLRPQLAEEWGLAQGVIVAGGGGDNAASAAGMGTVQKGNAFLSLGTSGVLFAANDAYLPNPESAVHTFCHALPHTWHQMGVILSAAGSMDWLSSILKTPADLLSKALGQKLEPADKVYFLPYLSGERTPHNDAQIRAAFLGLGAEHNSQDMTKAVMTGVAYAFCDNLHALHSAGTSLSRVTVLGGGSRSDYWLQILANVLNMPVDLPVDGDFGAAFGAARLGMLAATDENPMSVLSAPKVAKTIEPLKELVESYGEGYQCWKPLYHSLKAAL